MASGRLDQLVHTLGRIIVKLVLNEKILSAEKTVKPGNFWVYITQNPKPSSTSAL